MTDKKKSICIYASDLAVALRINQYQKLSDLIIKIWSKSFTDDYEATVQQLEKVHQTTYRPKEDDLMAFRKAAPDHLQKKMTDLLETQATPDLLKKRAQLTKQIEKDQTIDPTKKAELKKALTGATNKNFGTVQEMSAVQLYEQIYRKQVECPTQFVRKQICEYDGIKWSLGGKIDGVTTDGTLIEVKNRIHRLFRRMRDYERPQIQAYMWILGLDKGHLVESHKQGTIPEINVIEETFDPTYWNDIVVPKTQAFIRLFHQFLKDINLKTLVLLGDENEKERILESML